MFLAVIFAILNDAVIAHHIMKYYDVEYQSEAAVPIARREASSPRVKKIIDLLTYEAAKVRNT